MANNKQKKGEYVAKSDRQYHNPLKTLWGKILIVFLAILMVSSILISLIYLIVKASQNV